MFSLLLEDLKNYILDKDRRNKDRVRHRTSDDAGTAVSLSLCLLVFLSVSLSQIPAPFPQRPVLKTADSLSPSRTVLFSDAPSSPVSIEN